MTLRSLNGDEVTILPYPSKGGAPLLRAKTILYRCLLCNKWIPSIPTGCMDCACGNVYVDVDFFRAGALDHSKFQVLRGRTISPHLKFLATRLPVERGLLYPADEGFTGDVRLATVPKGVIIERYGRPAGIFAAEVGATPTRLALPGSCAELKRHRYEVVRELSALIGPVAPVPRIGAAGGAIQYRLNRPLIRLVRKGYLRELPPPDTCCERERFERVKYPDPGIRGVPRGRDLVYWCLLCGDRIPSSPDEVTECTCGNIYLDPYDFRASFQDPDKFVILRRAGSRAYERM